MENPYKILEVREGASLEEVKESYSRISKRLYEEKKLGSPASEIAEQRLSELNEAYDAIVNRLSSGQNPSFHSQSSGGSSLSDIRTLVAQNRVSDAEELLDGIPSDKRDAEWFFLKGSCCYRKGWLSDAFTCFETAVKLDPNNNEYRGAYNQLLWQKNGGMRSGQNGGYYRMPNSNRPTSSCSGCDMCTGLLCADCCCECMGGDCISCC